MKIITPDEYVDYMHVGQHQLTLKREDLSIFSNRHESIVSESVRNGDITPIYSNTFKKLEACAWAEKLIFSERQDDYGFFENGYINIPNWLDSSNLIDTINAWLDIIEVEMPEVLTPVFTPSVHDGSLLLERVSRLEMHKGFWGVIQNLKPLHDICKNIYKDEPYVFTNNRVIFKKPGCPNILIHRDGGWSRLSTLHHPMLVASISLTDVSKADRGLVYLPNSNIRIDDNETTVFDLERDFIFEHQEIGSLLLISQGVLHGTILSTQDGTRRSLQIIIISKTDIENFIEIKGYEGVKNTITYRGRNNIFNN